MRERQSWGLGETWSFDREDPRILISRVKSGYHSPESRPVLGAATMMWQPFRFCQILHPSLISFFGRANGYLQLISTGRSDMGRLLVHPIRGGVDQHDIRHFDIDESQNDMVFVTKENALFYSLEPKNWPAADMADGTPDIVAEPTETFSIHSMPSSQEFRYICETYIVPRVPDNRI